MKLMLGLLVLVAGLVMLFLHTTDTVLQQVQGINATYQYVANHADDIANGKSPAAHALK